MKWPLAVAVLGAVACSGPIASLPSPSTQAQVSPSTTAAAVSANPSYQGGQAGGIEASPSPPPAGQVPKSYAVLVDLFAGRGAYTIALVGSHAEIAAHTQGATRSEIADSIELPYVSVSKSRAYYLDGDGAVRYLKADGTTGPVTSISGDSKVHAAFAVSPDDTRIAVASLDYSVSPVRLTLYVEDLDHSHHAVIFTSTTHYVWPVAWHAGQLVVAYLGPNAVPFKSKEILYSSRDLARYPYGPNPYGGINFHVINPVTAVRSAIISGGGASGLLSKSGTAVVQGDASGWQGEWIPWDSPHDYGTFSAAGSLSPNGSMIAACCEQPAGEGHLVIWSPHDKTRILQATTTSGDWTGWLDNSHLVTGFYQSSDGTPSVVDLTAGSVTPVAAHGIVAAIFPSDLDA
jgi:hypothetical protein